VNIPQALDYNNTASWFSIPEECNENIIASAPSTSGSVADSSTSGFGTSSADSGTGNKPNPLENPLENPLADVFFIHGTVLEGEGKRYLDPANPKHRNLPHYPRIAHASCFEKSARVFQPHYRQVSLEVHFDDWDVTTQAYKIPREDIIAAYNAYMANWNKGRPLIIAGNSQGSILVLELLKYLHKNKKNTDNLIAAYIIGYTVTPQDLIECGLPLAQSFDDTKCIITYNALAQGAKQALTLFPNALCTNPLNWRTDSEYADKSLHLGRVDIHVDGKIEETPHFTDAWIDTDSGGLIIGAYTLETTPPRPHFPKGDLHTYNYPLFYRNIENNALERVKAYYKK